MKTYTRSMIIAAIAAFLPLSTSFAADACCAKDADKAKTDSADCAEHQKAKKDACCASESAAPVMTAFAAPPAVPVTAAAKELSETDRAFLAGYENVRAALAGDDFAAATKAAADLEGAEPIAKAKSIAEARVAFKALSATAIAKAKGHAGFWVAHCPMVKGGGADWLTTKKKIENPYFGSEMFSCGYIKE
ncbi:MAG TPA: hypothetical protein VMM36_16635 [Opitutaceae bacterium]|nr:hypothetical protein [Opitutaceae bacterium]